MCRHVCGDQKTIIGANFLLPPCGGSRGQTHMVRLGDRQSLSAESSSQPCTSSVMIYTQATTRYFLEIILSLIPSFLAFSFTVFSFFLVST